MDTFFNKHSRNFVIMSSTSFVVYTAVPMKSNSTCAHRLANVSRMSTVPSHRRKNFDVRCWVMRTILDRAWLWASCATIQWILLVCTKSNCMVIVFQLDRSLHYWNRRRQYYASYRSTITDTILFYSAGAQIWLDIGGPHTTEENAWLLNTQWPTA